MLDNYQTSIKFCFEVEPFDTDDYIFHSHSSDRIQRIEMTSNSTFNDVSLFIGSLLTFNNLLLNSEFIDALFKEDELALVGGLLFEQNNFKISSSCCFDFQHWILIVKDIKRGASPWMGHNPDPWFEFENDNIILWSDEDEREKIYSIQLTQQEFDEQLLKAKQELHCFLEKIKVWALQNYKNDWYRLVDGVKHYLFVRQD